MENIKIIEPSEKFDFSLLSLSHPTGIQGGSYFTKFHYNNSPLYIQTPKSLTKQGFVKNGKKVYTDLMFDNTNPTFIHWLENLELKCHELIYEKGETWFQNKLEKTDIENAFASPIRIYKSGKYYLIRANVKMNSVTNIPIIKIYDETIVPKTIDDINSDINIISILEIQGIKFTSRNFQIEIEIKQSMILNSDILFENCLIKPNKKEDIPLENKTDNVSESNLKESFLENLSNEIIKNDKNLQNEEPVHETYDDNDEESNFSQNDYQKPILKFGDEIKQKKDESFKKELLKKDELEEVHFETLDEKENELTEIQLNPNLNTLELMKLKKPNEVYYEIYKQALKKAKMAKKEAILAFLEAKNIKNTYMLDDLDDLNEEKDEFEDFNLYGE